MRSALAIKNREPQAQPLPLLCLPGTACDERVFAPMLAALDYAPVIVGAMTRFGSTVDTARTILAEAPERFALCGFSLGGIVALEMAEQGPDRIAGFALIGTNPRACPPEEVLARRLAAATARRIGIESYFVNQWKRLLAPRNRDHEDLKRLIVDMGRRGGVDVLSRQIEIAVTRADSLPRLSRIGVPTLVLSGEHEQVAPIEASREIRDRVPQAEMHLIPDAGHFAPLENPEAIAVHLRPWLDGLNGAEERRQAS